MVKLSAPKVAVIIEQKDGQLAEYTVQTDNRDFCQWDITRARNSWPEFQQAHFLWMTFMAFSALHRSGELPGVDSFSEFQKIALEIRLVDNEGNEVNEANAAEASIVGGTLPVPDFA